MARDRSDIHEVAVSSSSFFFSFLLGWPALVFSALSGRIAMLGSGLSVSEYAIWFFLASAPVAAYLVLLRGHPTGSISHALYDTELAGDAGHERPSRR
jgi:hypothetical protein